MTRPASPSLRPTGSLLLAAAIAPALLGLALARPASAQPASPPPTSPGPAAAAASSGAAASAPAASAPAGGAAATSAAATSAAATSAAATSAAATSKPAASAAPAASGSAGGPAGDAPITDAEMAAAQNTSDNPYIPVISTRRSGVVLGMTFGLALSSASGTPAKFSQRDNPVDTGFTPGSGSSFYIGGAFTDWFSFHVGGVSSSATAKDLKTSGGGVIFGVEAWPLFSLGGIYQDLGLLIDFGTGSSNVVDKNDTKTIKADGSGMSLIRGGVFLDPNLFWRINLGPILAFERRWNSTYGENIIWLGGRLAFYGGP